MASAGLINTPFEQPKTGRFNAIWTRFFQTVISWGPIGAGNGANGNVTAPALGTGMGPANPHAIVAWTKVVAPNGEIYWTPLCQ